MELLTSVFTSVLGWVEDLLGTITANAILLIPIATTLVGTVIGLAYKLLGVRRGGRRR